ncbi:unnamed protein product [Sphenostylis stenocarpa]|uniref:Uncharacterized protein n=1 Tax=Sphenostylis stenocarpa TaxID=92480 RepID=A0AA86RWS5_9FABA|nr:unnamed protein product [Sphenostylis stenocarpa]
MLSVAKRFPLRPLTTPFLLEQLRYARTRPKSPPVALRKTEERSEWWAVDGEMHEIGDHVPPRERFVIPRENIPNKRRKQLREQFMRRTRLVLKESEHDPWCKRYIELYNELRENWERLYWDEGYSKKLAQDHANYESAEDDDRDFSPYRSRRSQPQMEHSKVMSTSCLGYASLAVLDTASPAFSKLDTVLSCLHSVYGDQNFGRNRQPDNLEKVSLLRDKFEYDRERRMLEKAFAPMHEGSASDSHDFSGWNQPLNTDRYFSQTERH